MSFDQECFTSWTKHIHRYGLSKAYTNVEISDNYMPIFQYVMWGFGKLAGSDAAITSDVGYLKSVTLLFDFLGLWFVYIWLDRKFDYLFLLLLSVLNIGFSYNTLIWGQIDGIYCCLSFVSVYYAYNNKIMMSMLCWILAVNTKLQAIIILPALSLLYLFWLIRERRVLTFAKAIGMAAILQLIILLPFFKGHTLSLLRKEIVTSFSLYPWLGDNNFWTFIEPVNTWEVKDTGIFIFGLTYKTIGLLLFSCTLLVAIFPLLKNAVTQFYRTKPDLIPKEKLWLICALSAILFYFFNTEMHERYSHLAFLFLTAYAFYTSRYFSYLLFCLTYFLVLERGLHWFEFKNYDSLIFQSWFKASLYSLLIVYIGLSIYLPLRSGYVQKGSMNQL
jgi:Gpi18-like mannosyltransferase